MSSHTVTVCGCGQLLDETLECPECLGSGTDLLKEWFQIDLEDSNPTTADVGDTLDYSEEEENGTWDLEAQREVLLGPHSDNVSNVQTRSQRESQRESQPDVHESRPTSVKPPLYPTTRRRVSPTHLSEPCQDMSRNTSEEPVDQPVLCTHCGTMKSTLCIACNSMCCAQCAHPINPDCDAICAGCSVREQVPVCPCFVKGCVIL